jgi:hypothetical protein
VVACLFVNITIVVYFLLFFYLLDLSFCSLIVTLLGSTAARSKCVSNFFVYRVMNCIVSFFVDYFVLVYGVVLF